MPTTIPTTANFMNYAAVVFVGFGVIALVWYFAWGLKNYEGPPAVDEEIVAARRRSSITSSRK